MPSCSVKNCFNRNENGFRTFRFPTNPERRRIWIERCGITKSITPNSRLCEYHFDDNAFENKRADGKRKLKANAIPAIFSRDHFSRATDIDNHIVVQGHFLEVEKIDELGNIHKVWTTIPRHEENGIPQVSEDEPIFAEYEVIETDNEIDGVLIWNENSGKVSKTEIGSDMKNSHDGATGNGSLVQANEIKSLGNLLARSCKKVDILTETNDRLRLKLRQARKRVRKLENQQIAMTERLDNIPILKLFASGLENPRTKWSDECLKMATKIKYAVGWKAYFYLRKELGLPLPSYSTLCRHVDQSDISSEMVQDVFEFMENDGEPEKSPNERDCVFFMDEHDYSMKNDQGL